MDQDPKTLARQFTKQAADVLELLFVLTEQDPYREIDLEAAAARELNIDAKRLEILGIHLYEHRLIEIWTFQHVTITHHGIAQVLKWGGPSGRFEHAFVANAVNIKGDNNVVMSPGNEATKSGDPSRTVQTAVAAPKSRRFPTPAGARWTDVHMKERDNHSFSIKVRDVTKICNFTQMEMVDERSSDPDKQWELLRSFMKGRGSLHWESEDADPRNQKRREILARTLRDFFGIDEDPFVYREDLKGWQAKFRIEPKE